MKFEYNRRENRVVFNVLNWSKTATREEQEQKTMQWIFEKFDTITPTGIFEDVMIGTIQLFERTETKDICGGKFEIKSYGN